VGPIWAHVTERAGAVAGGDVGTPGRDSFDPAWTASAGWGSATP